VNDSEVPRALIAEADERVLGRAGWSGRYRRI